MFRPLAVRLVAALIGLSAGLAPPSTALAHAFKHALAAHEDNAEHDHEHEHHGPASRDHRAEASPGGSSMTEPGAEDHPHPRVEVAPTVRVEPWVAASVVAAFDVFVLSPAGATPPVVFADRFPGPELSTGPPPRLRAPPTG